MGVGVGTVSAGAGAVAVGSVSGRVGCAGCVTGAEVSVVGWLESTGDGVATTAAGAVAGGVESSGEAAEGVAAGMFATGVAAGSGVDAVAGGADFVFFVCLVATLLR